MNKQIVFLLITLTWVIKSSYLYSQSLETPTTNFNDSLKNKTYEELYASFYYNQENDTLYDVYAKEFLRKAYRENDTLKIAGGYYIITTKQKEIYFSFYDSLIKYSKLINENEVLWQAYDRKGDYFNDKRQFKKALETYIESYSVALIYKKEEYIDHSSASLGILKEKIGKNEEALEDFKRSYQYTSDLIAKIPLDSIKKKTGNSHLNRLHLLSNSYRLNGVIDSADQLNKEAQKYRKYPWAKRNINKIRLNAAEVHFDREQYSKAIDSATLAIPDFLDRDNLKSVAICHYIEGVSLLKLKKEEDGVIALRKMDSIYSVLGNIYPAARPGYKALKEYYEKKNDLNNQLYYVKQLLRFDSIAHTNYTYISEGIVDKIDKPNLIEEQKQLQDQLNSLNKNKKKWIVIGGVVLILLLIEILRRRNIILKKNKEQETLHLFYQKKFDELLIVQPERQVETPKQNEGIGIADNVVKTIRRQLELFEKNNHYTKTNITATTLAKGFNTNANYLGRIVKHYHKKSFRVYLNDLRIDLTLKKMRNDRSFKNYSIQAMAQEVGFKNAEPFSKSFKNRTGYYPSDFINQLKK